MRKENPYAVQQFEGINLFLNQSILPDNVFVYCKNMYLNTIGLYEKTKGTIKYNSVDWTTNGAIGFQNGIRYYWGGANKKVLVAIQKTAPANDEILVGDDANNSFSVVTGGTDLGSVKEYSFVTWIDKCYISNGTAPIQFTTDGITKADLTGTNIPKGKFLIVYKDRLYVAGDPALPSAVYPSNALDPTIFNSPDVLTFYCGHNDGDVITGMGILAVSTDTQGLRGQLAIFKNHSVYILDGDIQGGSLSQVSGSIGCVAYKTIINTSIGLIFFGENDVYLLRLGGDIQAIGTPIRSAIQDIPIAQRRLACAGYDAISGYYRLSFATPGSPYNNIQYWLDIRQVDSLKWVGPITYPNTNCFIPAFSQEDSAMGAGSVLGDYLYLLNQEWYMHDDAEIESEILTKKYDFGLPYVDKILNWVNVVAQMNELSSSPISLFINVDDGIETSTMTIQGVSAAGLWDEAQWDQGIWGGEFLKSYLLWADKRLFGKRFQFLLNHKANEKVMVGGISAGIKMIRRFS